MKREPNCVCRVCGTLFYKSKPPKGKTAIKNGKEYVLDYCSYTCYLEK